MPRRPAFWQAVALALLGHGAVLANLDTFLRLPAGGGTRAPVYAFQVRTVPAPPDAPAAPVVPTPVADPAVPAVPAVTQQERPLRSAQAPAVERREPPAVVAAAPARPPAAESPYLPRSQLTAAPRPQAMVEVGFPQDVTGVVDLTLQATLFIDEHGVVQRIRVDTPDVHPSFERTVRETFGPARFTPGERDGMPVRSQLRIEVEFHAPGRKLSLPGS